MHQSSEFLLDPLMLVPQYAVAVVKTTKTPAGRNASRDDVLFFNVKSSSRRSGERRTTHYEIFVFQPSRNSSALISLPSPSLKHHVMIHVALLQCFLHISHVSHNDRSLNDIQFVLNLD